MFLQNLENSITNEFQYFFKNNYNKKFMLKNLNFHRIGETDSELLNLIGAGTVMSILLIPYIFFWLFLPQTFTFAILLSLLGITGVFFHSKLIAYFLFKLTKSDNSLIQAFYYSVFKDSYISDEILNLLKIHLSPDEYKKLRFDNQNGITYKILNRFIRDKKQYLAIEEEQRNVTLTSEEISKMIDQHEKKNFVKFSRYK